jgi:ubiquitin-like protein Nedd8
LSQLVLKTMSGKTVVLSVPRSLTVLGVKRRIELGEGYPVSRQRLIFGGSALADDRTIGSYDIDMESTIHLVVSTS